MFSEKDLKLISQKGITLEQVERQLNYFKTGFPYTELYAPATKGNGIIDLSKEEEKELVDTYETNISKNYVMKFVPASGAASRMFKNLYSFREKYTNDENGQKLFESDKSFNSVYYFFENIEKFAFFKDLENIIKSNGLNFHTLLENRDYNTILDFLLTPKGLAYGELPKSLLKFHKYPDGTSRTSFEEHLVEAAFYCKNSNKLCHLHFTVSPEHIKLFSEKIIEVQANYEEKYNVKYIIEYSIQKPSTDTIAVNLDNTPFRDNDGNLVFRPGGHGALIENLNSLQADIIFIKNIDNVVPDRLKEQTYFYKKIIGGFLIKVKEQIHEILRNIDNHKENDLNEIIKNIKQKFNIHLPSNIEEKTLSEKRELLKSHLNRPIRVCGMVKNEGEPGGGPFWVRNKEGNISLQIVESSQIDFSNPEQKEIFNKSTHFNPVDIVCCIKNYKGEKFNLNDFIDHNTGFISEKSKDGKPLKAMELPGLWNGAMAKWLTFFIEVPLITFNPVKVINDLLRKEHL